MSVILPKPCGCWVEAEDGRLRRVCIDHEAKGFREGQPVRSDNCYGVTAKAPSVTSRGTGTRKRTNRERVVARLKIWDGPAKMGPTCRASLIDLITDLLDEGDYRRNMKVKLALWRAEGTDGRRAAINAILSVFPDASDYIEAGRSEGWTL